MKEGVDGRREEGARGGEGPGKVGLDTYLLLLLVEVVDDDADEQVQGEEGAEDDEDDEIEVHVDVHLVLGLFLLLQGPQDGLGWAGWAGGTCCLLPVPHLTVGPSTPRLWGLGGS